MAGKSARRLTPRTLAKRAAAFAADKIAIDIVILDLRGVTDFSDFFVICSGAVDVHVKAIYEHIESEFMSIGYKANHIEGVQNMRWILMDYIDIVVHIFQSDARSYYALERLWGDAKIVKFPGASR